jgi:FkbM family methyltransferase
MVIRAFAARLQRKLARSRRLVRLAVAIRNQCNCVIRYYLGETTDCHRNGERWLLERVARDAGTFIDVGANVGHWSELFLAATKGNVRGFLFEPSALGAAKLRQKFAREPRVEIIEAAVSDTVGEMNYYEEPDAGERSSLLESYSDSQALRRIVKVTSLDVEVGNRGIDFIDFLKIDTEGYDLRVLRGASQLLQKLAIGIVQFEYNSPWALAGSTLADAYRLLEGYGYTVFLLRPTGLFELNYSLYGEYFGCSNFVAVAPATLPRLKTLIMGVA